MSDNPHAPQPVVFDVGRVLFEWDLRHLYAKLIPDPAELDWFLANVVTIPWNFRHDEGHPLDESIPELKARFPEHAALIDAYVPRFADTLPGAVPGSLELVERLAKRGVPLFALTNFGGEFFAQFSEAQPVFAHFRDIVVSGVEKIAKPDPAIYRLAERRFGHAPAAMLFIDDNRDNVEAARACGWEAHHFVDAPTLALDLRKRGLIA